MCYSFFSTIVAFYSVTGIPAPPCERALRPHQYSLSVTSSSYAKNNPQLGRLFLVLGSVDFSITSLDTDADPNWAKILFALRNYMAENTNKILCK